MNDAEAEIEKARREGMSLVHKATSDELRDARVDEREAMIHELELWWYNETNQEGFQNVLRRLKSKCAKCGSKRVTETFPVNVCLDCGESRLAAEPRCTCMERGGYDHFHDCPCYKPPKNEAFAAEGRYEHVPDTWDKPPKVPPLERMPTPACTDGWMIRDAINALNVAVNALREERE